MAGYCNHINASFFDTSNQQFSVKVNRWMIGIGLFQHIQLILAHFVGKGVGKCKIIRNVLGKLESDGQLGLAIDFLEADSFFGYGLKVFSVIYTVNRSHS